MAPKCNSNDADNLDMPKRKYKVLLWSAKVKVLDLWGKKSDGEVAKIYGMNESLVYKIVKNKKKFMLLLLSCFKLQKLWTQFMISGAELGLWYLWVVAAMDKFTGTTEILWRKGTAWLLSKWERGPQPLPWQAFTDFLGTLHWGRSSFTMHRLALGGYLLQKTKESMLLITSKRKDICKCKGKSG